MEHYAAIKRDSVGSTQQHGAKPWQKILRHEFLHNMHVKVWNLTNRILSDKEQE